MYNAAEARALASGKRAIFDEIALMEKLVLDAIEDGALGVSIGPSMGVNAPVDSMTEDANYYNAYTNAQVYVDAESTKYRHQMNEVIKHFQTKGYIVRVQRHESTSTFNWVVKW